MLRGHTLIYVASDKLASKLFKRRVRRAKLLLAQFGVGLPKELRSRQRICFTFQTHSVRV